MCKILFIHHSGNLGGAPRSLKLILDRIKDEKCIDTSVLLIRDGPAASLLETKGVKFFKGKGLHPFHGSNVSNKGLKQSILNMAGLIFSYFNFPNYFKKGQYDIIHLNSTCLCFYSFFAKRIDPNVRVFCHIREPVRKDLWGKIISKVSSRYVDEFFAISRYDQRSISEDIRSTVVYNYVDVNQYKYKKPRNTSVKRICYFARLDEKNGILDFLRLADFLSDDERFEFVIYGFTGKEKEKVISNVTRYRKNVTVNNMTNDVIGVLNGVDVLVVPFLTPHFSRSVIEAAAIGRPSVVYNVEALNELVINGKTGSVVEVGNIEELKISLLNLLDEKVYNMMSKNARDLAYDKFSQKNIELVIDKFMRY